MHGGDQTVLVIGTGRALDEIRMVMEVRLSQSQVRVVEIGDITDVGAHVEIGVERFVKIRIQHNSAAVDQRLESKEDYPCRIDGIGPAHGGPPSTLFIRVT